MKRALFAGSFDPLTYGHLDIIERASKLTDELIIVVSASTKKTYLFTDQERLEMINNSLKDRGIVNCQAIVYDGLTVEVARNYDVDILIRAIRSVKDFEYERSDIANLNAIQDEKIETLCFFSEPKYQHISSTMVKEIAYYGGNVGELIPPYVEKNLKKAMNMVTFKMNKKRLILKAILSGLIVYLLFLLPIPYFVERPGSAVVINDKVLVDA